jgi:hypothetical protein
MASSSNTSPNFYIFIGVKIMPTSEQLQNAGKEAGGVVAGAIGSAVVAWMSGLLSEKYSSSDAEKLTAIRKLYMVELNAKTEPEHLSLDEQGYPKKKYITNIGSINIGIASDNRSGPGQYFASSKLFVGTIGTYLDARYKRTIGSGKKGDVLALVLIEWLDWANNHLPMLDYDNDSLKILEARKRYLSKLISNAYFRHSSYWRRGTTKFDTLIKLQNVLDGCIETCCNAPR